MIQILSFFLFFYIYQCKTNPPIIIEQPQDLIAELDKPMAIHCRAESSSLDDLQIDWYKDGRLVTTDPNARIITEFMALHFINTMPQDAGVYYCIAKNSYGQTQSRKARIQFLKLDKEFLVSPTSTMASIGERIHLRCQPPYGSPNPIVYWTKDGQNLTIPLNHHDLVIPSIKKSDFGIYRCIAFNGLIRQSSPIYLTEFHRPKISIQPSKSRIDLHRGQSIHLECHIDNDQYEILWYFQNKIFRNSTIDIISIDFNQSGIYKCIGQYEKYSFNEEILLAVYDREIKNNNEEIFSSQSILTIFLGQSAFIDCQLPYDLKKNISWTILNQTYIENIKYNYIDTNHYRLKINSIKEFYNKIFFQCSYQNEKSQGLIQLNLQHIQSPTIISYVPNNQTVPIGVDVIFSCETNNENHIQWWFIPLHRPYKTIKIHNNRKYRIEINHDLIIRHTEKNDAGIYKCLSINDQTTWIAHLTVEDARSNAIFHRVERKDLPLAPSQPIPNAITMNSIELIWNIQSENILDYLIEYFEVNFHPQWERFYTKTKNSRVIINNLKSDCFYQFQIRARNSFGYGLPSILSDLIQTSTNNQFIYLSDPIHIQETSLTIQWNILENENNHLIKQQLFLYIIDEKQSNERIEIISNSQMIYTINNLRPYTDYSIYLRSLFNNKMNSTSNKISVRTLESIPISSPRNILVELISITTLSIQWNPPLDNETNGQILTYKIHCLTSNESNSIRLTNISSDAKGLLIKNLIENTEYCISIAACTRIGYGPYSSPICVTMNEKFLKTNQNGLKYYFYEALSQPWFLPVIIISSIFFTCAFSYTIWLCLNYFIQKHHHHRIKFNNSSSLSSSSNHSVELPIQKTLSNGKRYDLIKETPPPPPTAVWMNSIPNSIRLQCCTTTTTTASNGSNNEHYSMNIQKNPINALLHESRQQQQLNPYATTGIFHKSPSPSLLTYSETVHPSHHQHPIISSSSSTQYQPPWFDHHPSSTLQYRSQSVVTPYNCIHCTSQSHPHTPSSIRTTLRSPSIHRQNLHSNIKFNEIKKENIDNIQIIMNSLPSQLQSPNPMMMNSLGGETMTTSWSSSSNDDDNHHHHHQSISSSLTDKKSLDQQNHLSSEGSIFSDTDIQQQQQQQDQHEEENFAPLVTFERGPSFFIPNV